MKPYLERGSVKKDLLCCCSQHDDLKAQLLYWTVIGCLRVVRLDISLQTRYSKHRSGDYY